jgi:hypothetical protein
MNRPRILLFALVVLTILLATGVYLWQVTGRTRATQALAVDDTMPASAVAISSPVAAITTTLTESSQPDRLLLIELGDLEHRGAVKVADLASPNEQSVVTPLRCRRMHFAAGVGICLEEVIGPLLTPMVSVTLFNEQFQPLHEQRVDGFPSRARVSPDGKYAAYTVFVTGHSYSDDNFSTATHILEVATGADLGNLESFEVWQAGKRIHEIDFNFWGVTFAQDSNRFYATLSTAGVPWLVEGDIAARRMTVLYKGVECPSLSPDNRRIAFKKARGDWEWQLTVLDLATLQETPLAEPESVDDQVEWLDNSTILYQQQTYDAMQNAWISIMRIPADGSGAPALFAEKAGSPAVVR